MNLKFAPGSQGFLPEHRRPTARLYMKTCSVLPNLARERKSNDDPGHQPINRLREKSFALGGRCFSADVTACSQRASAPEGGLLFVCCIFLRPLSPFRMNT